MHRQLQYALKRSFGSANRKKKYEKEFTLDRDNVYFKQFRQNYMLDDGQIFKFFKQPFFLRYMNENFRMLPFLFENNKLTKFRQAFISNEEYQSQIKEWFVLPQKERLAESREFPQDESITAARLAILQPFIELYLEFAEQNYKEELEISNSLSHKSDLRMPHEWFTKARGMQRRIIYHNGPTNSGKTFTALEELALADKGIYCAPLRLLAWEIQEKLEGRGIPCNLITGQEKIINEQASHTSCTIETASLSEPYQVAIIDEVQMIGDEDRGAAWTNALLGLQAETIHLCGDPRALALVDRICQITGDKFEERRYNRFSSLYVEDKPFKLEEDLKPGDCIITFSTRQVHQIKNKVNRLMSEFSNTCAVVYGKLPPDTRKDQARKFNDPNSDVQFLVATNAVGMGVNFQIKRIIFQTLIRRTKDDKIRIDDSEIKQIAGRAGRYMEDGFVTCMNNADLRIVRKTLKNVNKRQRPHIPEAEIVGLPSSGRIRDKIRKFSEANEISIGDENLEFRIREKVSFKSNDEDEEGEEEQNEMSDLEETAKFKPSRNFIAEERKINQAGLFPSYHQIETFYKDLRVVEKKPSTLAEIFKKFASLAQIEGIYFIQNFEDFCTISELIEDLNLTLRDKYVFSSAPLSLNDRWKSSRKVFRDFALQLANYNNVVLPEMFDEENKIFYKRNHDLNDLAVFEEMHHILDVYVWLSNKYDNVFSESERAQEYKIRVCALIEEILDKNYTK